MSFFWLKNLRISNGLISNKPILSHEISGKSNINHHTHNGKKTENLSTTTQDIVEGISVRNWSGKRGYIGRKMKAVFYFDYSTLKCSNIVAGWSFHVPFSF